MFRDFQQKDRTKPIKITDVAILKVGRLIFNGFSREENKYIQEQHQRLLLVSRETNNSEEVGILIDIIKWETYVIIGERNRIEMKTTPEAYKMLKNGRKNTLLFMHNHPSTSTFSGEDFKTFCNNEALYIITIVGNDGSVRALVKLADFEASVALNFYYRLAFGEYRNARNNGTLAMKKLLKNCESIGLLYMNGGRNYGR